MMYNNISRFSPKSKLAWRLAWLGVIMLALLILVLAAAALLLPPISILERIDPAYTSISRDGGAVHDPDGTSLTFLPEGVERPFRVKLRAVPRSTFLAGTEGENLLAAASAIPPNLIMKSPFYQIEHGGASPGAVIISMPIPNDAEPYTTLDLYTWDGQTWAWLPGHQVMGEEVIESEVAYLPQSVTAMQTQALNPAVAATYAPGDTIPDNFNGAQITLYGQGLQLEANGLIVGDLNQLTRQAGQVPSFSLIPTIRNWNDDGSIRSDLIDNLLIDPEARQQHIGTIVNLINNNIYQGVDLDYRGLNPDLRDDYSAFLRELKATLPGSKRLSVRVELPRQVSGETWETGAYDWQAIGQAADLVKVPALSDPKAYTPGGQMDALLSWAVGQINRYKLQLFLSTRSLEQVAGAPAEISYHQAWRPLGVASIVGGAGVVNPGQAMSFTLSGLHTSTGLQFDGESGLYWFGYVDGDNRQHTIYIENAASLSRKLEFIPQYNLHGVTVQGLFNDDLDPQIQETIRQFLNLVILPVENRHALMWRVNNEEGGLIAEEMVDLSQVDFHWAAPQSGGPYEVSASLTPNRNTALPADQITPLGSVSVSVAAP